MRMVDVIAHKRDGKELSKEEIKFWIDGLKDKSIPDYQTTALLMAIVFNDMSFEETTHLTENYLYSGDQIDLSAIAGKIVDKHSTGGVGDKTTLILSPIVAAAGGKVAKMSGRGLGHTGGTLDKLESIPGYHVELTSQEFIDQVNDINIAVVGQTGNLVYADKVIYGLRDVTATVDSKPLIAASVMSKKLAGGADCVLLDVKYGEGAFMKTVDDARQIAKTMIHIGESLGRRINAMITNMNQPLGRAIGNALEVEEAVLTLQNKGPKDLEELCLVASGYMLYHGEIVESFDEGYQLALDTLRSGKAYDKFLEWIAAQGGDISVFEDLDAFTEAQYSYEVRSQKDGYLHDLHALELGIVSMHLGAGRKTAEDHIDMKAGIILNQEVGGKIQVGDLLATLYSSNPIDDTFDEDTHDCFVIESTPIDKPKLIEDVL